VKKVTESYTDKTTNEKVEKVSEQHLKSGITETTSTFEPTTGLKR